MKKALFSALLSFFATSISQAAVVFTTGLVPADLQSKIQLEIAKQCPNSYRDSVISESYTQVERNEIDQGQVDFRFKTTFNVGEEVIAGNETIQPTLFVESELLAIQNIPDNRVINFISGDCQ